MMDTLLLTDNDFFFFFWGGGCCTGNWKHKLYRKFLEENIKTSLFWIRKLPSVTKNFLQLPSQSLEDVYIGLLLWLVGTQYA